MKIAIPSVQGKLSLHFGHCEQFIIFDVDDDTKEIVNRTDETPPAHEPGVLPAWLSDMGVNVIIAGGMGQRAQQLFTQNGVDVVVGVQAGDLQDIISDYLQGKLVTGDNACDH